MVIKSRNAGNIVIFDIDGEIRRSEAGGTTLHELVKLRLGEGSRNILLNCECVEFIDSYGVGEILASYISTQNAGGKLKLVRISRKLHVIFQVTMLTKVLEIYDNEASALQSYGAL